MLRSKIKLVVGWRKNGKGSNNHMKHEKVSEQHYMTLLIFTACLKTTCYSLFILPAQFFQIFQNFFFSLDF